MSNFSRLKITALCEVVCCLEAQVCVCVCVGGGGGGGERNGEGGR